MGIPRVLKTNFLINLCKLDDIHNAVRHDLREPNNKFNLFIFIK